MSKKINEKMTLNELVMNNEKNTRASKYKTYDSKKKLLADDKMLFNLKAYNDDFESLIKALKNVFSVAVCNTDNKYIVITMYYSTNKRYEYIACNVETLECVSYDSVKMAKNAITEIIEKNAIAEK